MTRLIVIGGGAAGMTAASVARRRDPDREVIVLEAGGHVSFSACGMPYWLGDIVTGGPDELVVLDPQEAREDRGIDVRLHHRVTGVDVEARTVTVQVPHGTETLAWDDLLLAQGVAPRTPFPVELEGVHHLRHLDEGIHLKQAIEDQRPERVAVVGGGYVGVEVAEGLLHRGDIETHLVHSRATLLSNLLPPALGEHVTERVREAGVHLHLEQRVQGLEGEGHVMGVRTTEGLIEADLVVLALGVTPHTDLAEQAGCELGPTGAIRVDERMATTVPHIWAAGDCVEYRHKLTDEPTFLPLALHANRAGRVAGENLTGGEATMAPVLGTGITRFEDLEIAATGLSADEAEEAGLDPVTRTIESVTRAGYFPGASRIHVNLVAERGTGRLLGGQIIGGPGAGKRIDTLAAAIWQDATAADLEAMDLAYAPPFSPTWDPLSIAARLVHREATR